MVDESSSSCPGQASACASAEPGPSAELRQATIFCAHAPRVLRWGPRVGIARKRGWNPRGPEDLKDRAVLEASRRLWGRNILPVMRYVPAWLPLWQAIRSISLSQTPI